jgi:transposase
VSLSSVTKIWGLFTKTGSYFPSERTQGRKKAFSDDVQASVLTKIEEQPDMTLLELIDFFDLKISESGLSKKLCKLGYSFKKRQLIQPNKREKTFKKNEKNG